MNATINVNKRLLISVLVCQLRCQYLGELKADSDCKFTEEHVCALDEVRYSHQPKELAGTVLTQPYESGIGLDNTWRYTFQFTALDGNRTTRSARLLPQRLRP